MQEIPRGNQPKKANKNQDEAEIIDLISPVDSPEKVTTETLFIGRTGGKIETKRKENEDETTNEENEKNGGRQQQHRRIQEYYPLDHKRKMMSTQERKNLKCKESPLGTKNSYQVFLLVFSFRGIVIHHGLTNLNTYINKV